MTQPLNLVMPLGPMTNNLYFTVISKGRPIRVPSTELKKYKAGVAKMCRQMGLEPFVGEVDLVIRIFRARRAGDTDGFIKSPIDALSGFAYLDDRQVRDVQIIKREDAQNPRIEMTVTPVGLC